MNWPWSKRSKSTLEYLDEVKANVEAGNLDKADEILLDMRPPSLTAARDSLRKYIELITQAKKMTGQTKVDRVELLGVIAEAHTQLDQFLEFARRMM